ncbi:VWA domain-containing protein, partial [Halorhodospira halochloris]|uniref:VWA domain-containing protein n=1 Tax=Halorhodospira halochloris TaxID=1052 RepID=UPI001903CFF2
MRLSTLNDALPIVAAAYGRKFGVKVRVGGQNAFTDGQSINIPGLSEEVRSRTLAYGYLAHEAGHVRFTDFTQARHPQPLGKLLEGVIEDIRIEAAMITTYPGTRKTLDAVLEHLIEAGRMQPPSDQDPPGQVLGNAVLLIGRYHYRRQSALQMHSQQSEEVLSQVFGQQFVRQLHGLLAEIPGLTCTAETMALAQRIISLLESLSQGQSPEQANAADQPDNQPADDHAADDQASGKDDSQEGQLASGEDCAGASADEGADAEASAATDADSGDEGHHEQPADSTLQQGSTSQQGCSSEQDSSLAAQAAQAALQADKDALPEDLFEAVGNILQSHSSDDTQLLPTVQSYQGDAELGKEALERVKVHSAHLNAQLQGLVQSQRLTRSRTARSGRRLSAKHLHRAGVADSRIFRTSRAQPAPNTALHLLIDLSLSMQGGPDRLALDAAMSLALALESINGVSRAVSVFPG